MTFPLRVAKLEVTRTPDSHVHIAWGLGPKQIALVTKAMQTTGKVQQENQ